MKKLFPILFLLVCIPNLGYAERWLDEGRAPKELHVGGLIIIEGCRGEYCNEFCDRTIEITIPYPDSNLTSYWFEFLDDDRSGVEYRCEEPIGIKASRPFAFYNDLAEPSPIATYNAGVIVKPIEQMIVVRDRGDYVIEKVINKDFPLEAGDKIDTLIYWDEGQTIVRSKGRWTWFYEQSSSNLSRCLSAGDCSELKLKVNREAKVEDWLKLEVDGMFGFARDDGFLICWLGRDLPPWRSYLSKLRERLGFGLPLPTYCTPYSS